MSTSDKKYFKYYDYIITITVLSRTTSRNNFVTNLSSTQTDHLLDSTSTEMYATISLITTSIILTDNLTSDKRLQQILVRVRIVMQIQIETLVCIQL